MSNDVLTNVILVDDLIKDINNEITDVKDVLGVNDRTLWPCYLLWPRVCYASSRAH